MAQCDVRLCEICEHSPGNHYCINCEQYFCNNCKMSHLKAKVSKMHKFEDADKVNPEIKIPKCEQHQDSFAFFCNACNSLLCQVCLTETHKKHDFSLVSEAVSSKRSEVKSSIQSAEKSTNELQTNVSMLESKLGKFQDHCKTVVDEIDSRRRELIEMIGKVSDDYIARVKQHETKESQRMKQEIEKRQMAVQEDKVIIEDTKIAMEDGDIDDVKFLATVIDIQNKLMSLTLSESNVNQLQNVKFTREPAHIKEIKTLVGSLSIMVVRPRTSVKIGDLVKVKESVTEPHFGWASVNHTCIGTVASITDDLICVDFPGYRGWRAKIDDLQSISTEIIRVLISHDD